MQTLPGANSSPGMNQPPMRSPLPLSLLEHGLDTWTSIQQGQSAQLRARRRHPAPAEPVPPSLNAPFLLAGCSNPWLGALPAPRAASRCHVLPTRSGNPLNKGISPKGTLSIKDSHADCHHAQAPLCICFYFLKAPLILKINSGVFLWGIQ